MHNLVKAPFISKQHSISSRKRLLPLPLTAGKPYVLFFSGLRSGLLRLRGRVPPVISKPQRPDNFTRGTFQKRGHLSPRLPVVEDEEEENALAEINGSAFNSGLTSILAAAEARVAGLKCGTEVGVLATKESLGADKPGFFGAGDVLTAPTLIFFFFTSFSFLGDISPQ